MRIEFGPFVLDADTRELTCDGAPLHVTPKALRLLEILVEERPKAVAKETLVERLWPGQYVADSNLASLVAELRRTLGERARAPRYLRTVHRYGYAFRATATPLAAAAQAHHRILLDTREVTLAEGENVLGRDPQAVVWLEHASVSRRHARIVVSGRRAVLEDLESKNGTHRGTERVTGPVDLDHDDRLRLGSMELTYRCLPVPDETRTVETRHPRTPAVE